MNKHPLCSLTGSICFGPLQLRLLEVSHPIPQTLLLSHILKWEICGHGQSTGPRNRGVSFSSLSNHFSITSGRFHLSVLKLLVNNLGVKLPFFCPYSALSTKVMSCCWHWNYFCVCAEHSRGFACPLGFHYNSDHSKGNFKRGENICFQAGSVTCLLSLSTGCTRKESAFEIKLGLGDSWSWNLTPGVVMCI